MNEPNWRERAESAEKACAEMRDALQSCRDLIASYRSSIPNGVYVSKTLPEADAALAAGAGRDYIHRDEVKPLVEALKFISQHCGWPNAAADEAARRAESALAAARPKGLIQ